MGRVMFTHPALFAAGGRGPEVGRDLPKVPQAQHPGSLPPTSPLGNGDFVALRNVRLSGKEGGALGPLSRLPLPKLWAPEVLAPD